MSEHSSSIKQALAAVGVILSLIFVGYEIRQNTTAVRGATLQAISDQAFELSLNMAQDDHWPRIMAFFQDGGEYADLEPEDLSRVNAWLISSIRIMENRYRQRGLGLLDDSELDAGGGRAMASWYRSHFFLAYWQTMEPRSRWADDFVDFMEVEVLAIR